MTGIITRRSLSHGIATAILLWFSQPPLAWWPLAFVALVPVIRLITETNHQPYFYRLIWLASFLYWLVTLQGLRHAHPLMFICWIALCGYLAIYLPLFVAITRRLSLRGVPVWVSTPLVWVGCEAIRNYGLTGISAVMLGHSMADVPQMIQIADLFGTYGVSYVIAAINTALALALDVRVNRAPRRDAMLATALAVTAVAATFGYGVYRMEQPTGPASVTVALIQRNERTEYELDRDRELRIFDNYWRQSIEAVQAAEVVVDAIVWPESMLSGALPWMEASKSAIVPPQAELNAAEFQSLVAQNQAAFLERAAAVQQSLVSMNKAHTVPHLIGGCGVLKFDDRQRSYSGIVDIGPDGRLAGWYGKTHLVMFGEYIPLVSAIPVIRDLVPEGMGIETGDGPTVFPIGSAALVPNICIETAVERVTINQLHELHSQSASPLPDAIVTVTNDAWFNASSVVEHHLRCAQLVAVGSRTPILSAANGGPTAWIDSSGRIVKRLHSTENGAVIASPKRDQRQSFYVRIGDLPARLLGAACLLVIFDGVLSWFVQWRSAGRAAANSLVT